MLRWAKARRRPNAGLSRSLTQHASVQQGDLTLAPTVALTSPRPFRSGSVALKKGYSTGSEMVTSSIKVVGNASDRLTACTMPRAGSRAAIAQMALEHQQEQEQAPRSSSPSRGRTHVSSSPAPSGGVMLMEAVRTHVAARCSVD